MDFKDLRVQLQEPEVSHSRALSLLPLLASAVLLPTWFCVHNGGQDRKQKTELLYSFNLGQLLAAAIKIMSFFQKKEM